MLKFKRNVISIVLVCALVISGINFTTYSVNAATTSITKLKFQDFAKFGWPLLIISWILCIAILPQVFPFF